MSKRTKKFSSKRSALQVEALEQRQLLATIVAGSGTEVNSDVKLANGNTYDQILLTGSTVTVTADTVAGVRQVTRVDFLDADGDIVRAEFSGAGTMKVDLAGFADAAAPTKYNTTTKYVSGNATFTIVGSDETTNFSVFSLGSANVNGGSANKIFEGGKAGGNNVANVAALVIQDNGTVLGNAFGRIGAGNAQFSAATGAVGIVAPKIQFQGDIIIGDIDATGIATAQLKIGEFSANKTVTVTGGDLKQTTGALAGTNIANVSKLISTSGQTSFGVITNTSIIDAGVAVAAADVTYKSSAEKVTINGQTATQAELDVYKTKFLNEVEIVGGLKEGLTFAALMIGNVTVGGDLAGLITTDVDSDNASDTNELSIGNVTINGNIVAKGALEASTSIGNVTVTGGIDFTDVDSALNAKALAIIGTLGRASFSDAIGTVSFGKDVKLDNENIRLAAGGIGADGALAASGGVGNITVTGELTGGAATVISAAKGAVSNITASKAITIGAVSGAAGVGAISGTEITIGAITAGTGGVGNITSSDGDITLTGVVTGAADKTIGNIIADGNLAIQGAVAAKSVGNISAGGSITTTASIVANNGSVGTITAGDGLTVGAAINAGTGSIGAITVSKGDLTLNGALGVAGGSSIGNITVSKGDFLVNQTITAKAIGNISVTAGTTTGGALALAAGKTIAATDGSIGTITVTGATGTTNANRAGVISFADAASQVSATKGIGDITVTRGYITGVANSIEFTANTIGNVSVTARADAVNPQEYLLSNVIFQAKGTTETTVGSAKIGNITLDASANADGYIVAGEAADDSNDGTGFSSSGNVGNISLKTADGGKLLAANTAGLVFRAGSAGVGGNDAADTFAGGVAESGNVSIGTVSIVSDLSQPLSNGAAGQGLVIASGVNLAADGVFVSGTGGGVQNAVAKQGSGSSIGAVTLEDLSGNVTHNGFVSATLPETGDDTAFTAGSVIIADTISSVSLKTGAGTVLNLTSLNGLPLKGVVGQGVGAQTSYDAGEDTNLFVVVL